jgi:hypothetical protein
MAFFFGGTDLSVLPRPGPGFALPPPAIELPRQDVRLPHPNDVSAARLDLRGLYQGTANVEGAGSAPFTLRITRQRRGRISGTIASPALDEPVSGTVRVTFTGDRRFTFRLASGNGDDAVVVTGRVNRDGSITGSFSGQFAGDDVNGTFSLNKIGGPGARLGIIPQ